MEDWNSGLGQEKDLTHTYQLTHPVPNIPLFHHSRLKERDQPFMKNEDHRTENQ